MELLMIRIGKAWDALRREGLFRGGRRIILSGLALFRPVRPGDVLFITGGVGDSARYRCDHVAEELNVHGIKASVTMQDSPFLLSYVGAYSVFIFHRVLFTDAVATFIEALKERGKEIIFETDDLTYDPTLFGETDAYAQMGPLERKLYEKGLGGEILADPYVKVCTTTTGFLADRLREKEKQVFIVPNKLLEEDVRTAEKVRLSCHPELVSGSQEIPDQVRNDNILISYFSGSASHNADFATITEPLLAILEKYPEAVLAIYGPLRLDKRFDAHDAYIGRIKRMPYVPREEHWRHVAATDINLAPLVMGDPFCESKSELKFFEAGICGVPTVASATRTFREAITDGVDGFACASSEEWSEKLERLVSDPELRKTMGEKARETTLVKYVTTVAGNGEYYEYLKSKVVNSKQ
jgi:glycosyltransferase involved in cell wall biosynthesis